MHQANTTAKHKTHSPHKKTQILAVREKRGLIAGSQEREKEELEYIWGSAEQVALEKQGVFLRNFLSKAHLLIYSFLQEGLWYPESEGQTSLFSPVKCQADSLLSASSPPPGPLPLKVTGQRRFLSNPEEHFVVTATSIAAASLKSQARWTEDKLGNHLSFLTRLIKGGGKYTWNAKSCHSHFFGKFVLLWQMFGGRKFLAGKKNCLRSPLLLNKPSTKCYVASAKNSCWNFEVTPEKKKKGKTGSLLRTLRRRPDPKVSWLRSWIRRKSLFCLELVWLVSSDCITWTHPSHNVKVIYPSAFV